MSRWLLFVGIILAVAFLVGVGWLTWTVPRSIATSRAASSANLEEMQLDCPNEAVQAAAPWGEVGWMVYCDRQGTLHGPWVAAEAGGLVIRGEYSNGERSGLWEWYDDKGEVAKHVTYPESAAEPRRE